jgi:putative ATP-dependent endonuclease of OLD family
MYISRIIIRNIRNLVMLDIALSNRVTCIVGENNTRKTNFLHGLRLALDSGLSLARTLDFQSAAFNPPSLDGGC